MYNIFVLLHGASDNKEVCQPIHKEKDIMVFSYPHSHWVWIQLCLRKFQNLSWPYVKSGHKPTAEHSGYKAGMGRFGINDVWKSKAGCVHPCGPNESNQTPPGSWAEALNIFCSKQENQQHCYSPTPCRDTSANYCIYKLSWVNACFKYLSFHKYACFINFW